MMDFSFTSIQLWLVAILAFFVAYNYLQKAPWRKYPPGPIALPFVGSLPFMGFDLRKPFMKMAAKYGDIFTVYVGTRRVVVLHSLEVIKEAYVHNAKSFADRPHTPQFVTYCDTKRGFMVCNGPMWKEQRTHVLHSMKQVGPNITEELVMVEMTALIHAMKKQGGKPFEPMPLMQKAFANIIVALACGKRFDYDDPAYVEYVDTLHSVFAVFGVSATLVAFPFLRFLPGDIGGLKKMDTRLKIIHKIIQDFIDEQKVTFKDKYSRDEPPTNLIESFMQKMKKEENNPNSYYNEKQLLCIIMDLLLAGTDTTVTTIDWALVFMVLQQDVQARCQAEIDEVLGKEPPTMSHMRQMPYVEACINEIHRCSDSGPFPGMRAASEDVYIKGYLITKGTMVQPSIHCLHQDPKIYPEPREFRVERFLNKEGKPIVTDYFAPFGHGKRQCVGSDLAKMDLFLCFTSLVQAFKILPAPGFPLPEVDGQIIGLTHMPYKFHMIMEERH